MTETVAQSISGTLDNDVLLGTPAGDMNDALTDKDNIAITLGRNESQKPQIEVLASGLDSPCKLSFGPDGALYVVEAGRGGTGASIPSSSQPGAVLSYGATGAITHIQDGKAERVVTGLPSLALPAGRDAAGVNDIEFDVYGNAYASWGWHSGTPRQHYPGA